MNISKTPRFIKDYNSFSSVEKLTINKLIANIKRLPVPPNDDDWKELRQFKKDYPDGIVCAHRINHFDRLVYELDIVTGGITFTNCRGHKYRGKTYCEIEESIVRSFSEIRESCKTKGQRLAFNQLLNSFKFKE